MSFFTTQPCYYFRSVKVLILKEIIIFQISFRFIYKNSSFCTSNNYVLGPRAFVHFCLFAFVLDDVVWRAFERVNLPVSVVLFECHEVILNVTGYIFGWCKMLTTIANMIHLCCFKIVNHNLLRTIEIIFIRLRSLKNLPLPF